MLAIIFDMDGVLVDSEPEHIAADVELLASYGVDIDRETVQGYTGLDPRTFFQEMARTHRLTASVETLIAQKNDLLYAKLQKSTRPVDGLTQMMEDITALAMSRALASSSHRLFVDLVLDNLSLRSWFHATVAGDEVSTGKPEPDVFLKAASMLGIAPESCVVLEDSTNGVMSARAAGMRVVGLANPNSGNQDLSMADEIIASLQDFPDIISDLRGAKAQRP